MTKKSPQKPLTTVAADEVALLAQVQGVPKFADQLKSAGLFPLRSTGIEIFQVNVGYVCNQTCEHCHVDAGPYRTESMSQQTMEYCLDAIDQLEGVHTVDITGGAPEMNPQFKWFVEQLSARKIQVIVRSNLTILVANQQYKSYPEFFKDHGVKVIASLPCYTASNVDKQRGDGVFTDSIQALKVLNELGYGKPGSGLEIDLVYNPGGPFLPPSQEKLKVDYQRELKEHFDIVFNELYAITNIPIRRYLDYLQLIGKLDRYMETLANAFNPMAAEKVMCRNTLSVAWDGTLYDCDFNQMIDLDLVGGKTNISNVDISTLKQRNIAIAQHCYGCTAGAGSSCQGTLT